MIIPSEVPPPRYALGLPAGSIRAILALMIVGLICILMLLPLPKSGQPSAIPAYLGYLLFLVLGHFFAAHGHTIAKKGTNEPNPLYLPKGVIRFVLVAALVATVGWKYHSDPQGLKDQLNASVQSVTDQPLLPVILLAGFFVGVIVRSVVGRENPPAWFQDLEGWLALVAILALSVEIMIRLVINPSLEGPLELRNWEGVVAAIIAFYFGERS
jgi:hypothetical protein